VLSVRKELNFKCYLHELNVYPNYCCNRKMYQFFTCIMTAWYHYFLNCSHVLCLWSNSHILLIQKVITVSTTGHHWDYSESAESSSPSIMYFCLFDFNIIIPPTLTFPRWSSRWWVFTLMFCDENCLCVICFPHANFTPILYPSHPLSFKLMTSCLPPTESEPVRTV
jgi:hypothetical protein